MSELPEDDAGFVECHSPGCALEFKPTTLRRWNTRPFPELPEGYREERVGEQHRMLDAYGGVIATHDCAVIFTGAAPTEDNLRALAIWLQRRLANAE